MRLPVFIAKRYLFSKSNRNAVNIISWISVIAITVVSAAMFIILSGFNGIEQFVKRMYSEFDAQLKVVHQDQQFFQTSDELFKQFDSEHIVDYSKVLEAKCLYISGSKQEFGVLKGVDSKFKDVSLVPTKLVEGEFINFNSSYANIVLGQSLCRKLGIGIGNTYTQVEVWIPKPNKKVSLDITNDFRSQKYATIGTFSISPEYDPIYGISDLKYAQKLINKPQSLTSIEVRVTDKDRILEIQELLKQRLGKYGLDVLTIEEQHADFLKFVDLEKWFVIFIFMLIILLAAFNLIGSLSILIIEKKDNLKTLLHMGATPIFLRTIFWNLNYLMNGIGLVCGLIIGFIVCYLQDTYSLLLMGSGSVGIPYPIDMQFTDVLILIALVFVISTICAFFSIRKIRVKAL